MTSFRDCETEFSVAPASDDASGGDDGASPRKVLVIFHRPESEAGAVGQWLRANGYQLDIRCPRAGSALPATLADHAGAIIFGGPMSVNDPEDYIRAEIDWISVPLRENKPYFGICLGVQMLAKQLGGEVGYHPDELVEVGYYPIEPSEGGAALMQWPRHVYQWHREGFTLPSGAKRLATGGAFENQAMQYGDRAFGVQFHPEATLAIIHRWTTHAVHRLSSAGAMPRSEHILAHDKYGGQQRAWLDRFMRLWLRLPRARHA